MMAGFCCVTLDWPSFVLDTLRFGVASKRTARRAETENVSFDFEPVLKEAHRVWGPMFEKYAQQKLGAVYEPVLGDKFDISNGKQWEIDFLVKKAEGSGTVTFFRVASGNRSIYVAISSSEDEYLQQE